MKTNSPTSDVIPETDFDVGFAIRLWSTVTIKAKSITDAEDKAKLLNFKQMLDGDYIDFAYDILQIHSVNVLKKLGI